MRHIPIGPVQLRTSGCALPGSPVAPVAPMSPLSPLSPVHRSHALLTTTPVYIAGVSANAGGPRDPSSRKIDHIALPTEYNYQATSVGR